MQNERSSILDPTEIGQIFRIVYGRDPETNELNMLADILDAQEDDYIQVFRAVLSRFNHQILKTPFSIRFSANDVAYIPMQSYFLASDKHDIAVSSPLAIGSYETQLQRFYSERLKPGMTFLDIGANIGLYTMLAAERVGAEGHVISFEPNSENCRLILLGMEKNGFKNVSIFPLALSDENGYAYYTNYIGSNGGFRSDTERLLSDPSCIVIPVARLNDLVKEKVDFIKIDVEGAEGLVVEGAKMLIERYRPIITSEFSMEMLPRVSRISCREYLGYFKNIGYDVFIVDRDEGNLVSVDNIDTFLASYGSLARIEDLAFIPKTGSRK